MRLRTLLPLAFALLIGCAPSLRADPPPDGTVTLNPLGQIVSWVQFPPAQTNYTVTGPMYWTRIATVRMQKTLPETRIKCDFMVDIETETPNAVYMGLWVNGANWASGTLPGALPNSPGGPGLIVMAFTNVLGYGIDPFPAGDLDIDIMAMVAGTQTVTFQRRNWGIQCYEMKLPAASPATLVNTPDSPLP